MADQTTGPSSLVFCLYYISEEGANPHNAISNYAMVPIRATFLFHFDSQLIHRSKRCYYPLNSFLCCAGQTPFPMTDIQQDTVVANRLKIKFGQRRTRLKSKLSSKTVFQNEDWNIEKKLDSMALTLLKFYAQAVQWFQIHTRLMRKTKQVLRSYVNSPLEQSWSPWPGFTSSPIVNS